MFRFGRLYVERVFVGDDDVEKVRWMMKIAVQFNSVMILFIIPEISRRSIKQFELYSRGVFIFIYSFF